MKILVTGASGFIGQSLIKELKIRNINFVGVVRQLSYPSLDELIEVRDFAIPSIWQKPLINCDVIIHLAARAHVMYENSNDSLDDFIQTNVEATLNLAREAVSAGVKRFIYVSSIGVHGDETNQERLNELSPFNPCSSYGLSKKLAEQGLYELCSKANLELVIVRPPLVYGPNNPGNMLKLINLLNTSIPLPFGNIKNSRSFIYLGNLLDALILCATHPKASKQIYIVSDGEDISTTQLFEKIAFALNKQICLFPIPLSAMRFFANIFKKTNHLNKLTQSLLVDSSKIRKELDWHPPYTMEQGLKITADWFKNK